MLTLAVLRFGSNNVIMKRFLITELFLKEHFLENSF